MENDLLKKTKRMPPQSSDVPSGVSGPKGFQLADPTGIPLRLNLAHQHRRRDPVELRRFDPLPHITLVRVQRFVGRGARGP